MHTLAHCGHCDIVYCTACKREWGTHSTWYPYAWTVSSGSTTIGSSFMQSTHTHE